MFLLLVYQMIVSMSLLLLDQITCYYQTVITTVQRIWEKTQVFWDLWYVNYYYYYICMCVCEKEREKETHLLPLVRIENLF